MFTIDKVDDDDDDIHVKVVAKRIASEIKGIVHDKTKYVTSIDMDEAFEDLSDTLASLLSNISSSFDLTLPAIMVGNIVISCVSKRHTTLQIALGVLARDKKLIQHLHEYSVTSSYDEVRRFKISAAAASDKTSVRSIFGNPDQGLIQTVANNFDATISSQNGLRQTHSLAMMLAQPRPAESGEHITNMIPRIKHEDLKNVDLTNLEVTFYTGPNRPAMPSKVIHGVLPLKFQCNKVIITHASQEKYMMFLQAAHSSPNVPDYHGFNTMHSRESGEGIKRGIKLLYTPLIDRIPSNPTTMLTAMIESQQLTNESGQQITIFTADQQLYRVMVNITWVYPETFLKFIPRLGGMHWLMSFVGCAH